MEGEFGIILAGGIGARFGRSGREFYSCLQRGGVQSTEHCP